MAFLAHYIALLAESSLSPATSKRGDETDEEEGQDHGEKSIAGPIVRWTDGLDNPLGCSPEPCPKGPICRSAMHLCPTIRASCPWIRSSHRHDAAMDASLPMDEDGLVPMPATCESLAWSIDRNTFRMECGRAEIGLLPGIHADGEWREPAACEVMDNTGIQCHFSQSDAWWSRLKTRASKQRTPPILTKYSADICRFRLFT